jgi:general secretion pathway protein L
MTILRVRLPDVADPNAFLESLETQDLEYVLLQASAPLASRVISGTASLANMPRADSLEVVLPARAVRLLRVKVPRAKAAVLQRVLPNLVEDALVGESANTHYALLPGLYAEGRRDVAVTDRGWMRLARRVAQSCPARRSVCLSEALLVPGVPFIAINTTAQTMAEGSPVSGFVRYAQGVLPFTSEAGALPVELRLLRSTFTDGASAVPLAGATPEVCKAWATELDMTLSPSAWSWHNAPAADPALSLFQSEFARTSNQAQEWRRVWRWPFFLASTCVVVAIVGLNLHWLKLQREVSALRARMSADFGALLPGMSDRGEPLLMVKRQLSRQQGDDTFLVLSQALAQAVPTLASQAPPVKRLDYRDGVLKAELQPALSAPTVLERLRTQRELEVRAEGNVLILSRRGA